MSALTFPILQVLSDGKFHSGEDLADRFTVTRATVWNAIQHAEKLGVEVFSVRGRGYRLPQPIDMLDAQAVLTAIGEQREWFNLQLLDEVDSTNSYLMKQASKGAPHVTCVAAHIQISGKGRRGRTWVSHLGASLTFSLLWRFNCGAAALSGLSLTAGVALMRAFNQLGVEGVSLKWPNDVLYDNKKLAGILIELQGDMDGPSAAVIGVGVNLRLPENVLKRIDQPAIDLVSIGVTVGQGELLGTLLRHLAEVLRKFEEDGFVALRAEWLSYHVYHNRPVRILMPDGRDVHGTVRDVAEDGILLVETALGMQRFSAGEISLRTGA
jgi:BirA family biotin operon repressor/biotin-[acetyl-CoA-carboxylase] ligase